MKIISLTASNVLRLAAVEVTPDGNTVIISGKNAQGKSSVLNAIWLALDYAAAHKVLEEPLKQGTSEGQVTIDLGEFTVTREFSGDKTRLKVENRAGARYPSPQAMLDKLIGSLSFDPVAFAGMKDTEQVKVLRDLLGADFSDLDRERKEAYEERAVVNRQLKEAEVLLADLPEPEAGESADPVKIKDLQTKIAEATQKQQLRSDLSADINAVDAQLNTRAEMTRAYRQEIDRLQADIDRLEEESADLAVERAQKVKEFDAVKVPNLGSLTAQLAEYERSREAAREHEEYLRLRKSVESLAAESYGFTKRLNDIDATKEARLAELEMPIEGLSFDENGVLYRGVPFRQASQAEQLRVSMAMAMALNPELRVIRVLDASLLDKENMAIIQEMADEHDFQVWLEVVADGPGQGIYIEDGRVVATEKEDA